MISCPPNFQCEGCTCRCIVCVSVQPIYTNTAILAPPALGTAPLLCHAALSPEPGHIDSQAALGLPAQAPAMASQGLLFSFSHHAILATENPHAIFLKASLKEECSLMGNEKMYFDLRKQVFC